MGEFANRLLGIFVEDLGLGLGDSCEGCDLAVVEARVFAEFLEADGFGDDGVEFG